MSTSLKSLRKEVWDLLDPADKDYLRSTDIDQYINDTIRELVLEGELLFDSAITTSIDDQERYDFTSSTIWIKDSGTTGIVNTDEVLDSTETVITTNGQVEDDFSLNQLIKIDDEVMRITGLNVVDITVVRGVAGTTAASHVTNSDIYVGSALNVLEILRVDYDEYAVKRGSIEDVAQLDVT